MKTKWNENKTNDKSYITNFLVVTITMFGFSKVFFLNTFIQQGCIKWNKSDNKEIDNNTKHFCFKSMLFFLTFYSSEEEKKMCHGFHKNIKHDLEQISTLLTKRNV